MTTSERAVPKRALVTSEDLRETGFREQILPELEVLYRVARRPDLLEGELARRLPARGHGRLDGTSDQALAKEFDPIVRDALAALSPDHRALIALVDLDGLSYQEASDLLHVPAGTVMSRLHRARRKVRSRLVQHGITQVCR